MNAKKLIRIKIALIVIVALFSVKLAAQDTISFTWKVESNKVLGFAIKQTANYGEFTVNWGDGADEERISDYYIGLRHTYSTSGKYTVTIAASDTDCGFSYFSCYSNQLTELDLTGCSGLQTLDCQYNQLTELDLSNCPNLQWLWCAVNQLTRLDLTGCKDLTRIECYLNQLTELDLTGCSKLKILYCDVNQLTRLDLTGCPDLIDISCFGNQLTLLDLTGCSKLKILLCFNNQLQLSDLFAANLLINYPDLGTQTLQPQTVIIGEELFSEQSVFNGIFTKYSVTQNGNPAPESDYSVIDGKLTFNTVGIYTATMTNDAITSSHQVIVEITVEKGTGIAETLHATSLQVFPNPTSGELRITNQESGIGNIEIFDAAGKSVFKKQLSIINHQLSIDISHLPAGIYFLHVDEQTVKVVKK